MGFEQSMDLASKKEKKLRQKKDGVRQSMDQEVTMRFEQSMDLASKKKWN